MLNPDQIDAFANSPAVVAPPPSPRQRAKVARDRGIERAGDHADSVSQDWTTRAAMLIGTYAQRIGQPFLIEDARASISIESPPDGRAWGKATTRAVKDGLIRKIGYAPSKSSNLSPKVLWESI